MSILTQNRVIEESSEVQTARRLLQFSIAQFDALLQGWSSNLAVLWTHPNPQGVLDVLGTDALEMFEMSGKTAYLLEMLKPGCTAPTLTLIRPYTVHENGTITINPPVEPTPEPEPEAPVEPEPEV